MRNGKAGKKKTYVRNECSLFLVLTLIYECESELTLVNAESTDCLTVWLMAMDH